MKPVDSAARAAMFFIVVLAALPSIASAQDGIYRCANNEYINNAKEAQAKGCKLLEGGNVTVVQGTKVQTAAAPASTSNAPAVRPAVANNAPRPDVAEQRARDSDQRQILESELKKAESKLTELLKEFNGGEPEKRGDEARNHQKYLDRVAELKAGISRHESDVAGIKRELQRTYK
jgi:hypothetical protein